MLPDPTLLLACSFILSHSHSPILGPWSHCPHKVWAPASQLIFRFPHQPRHCLIHYHWWSPNSLQQNIDLYAQALPAANSTTHAPSDVLAMSPQFTPLAKSWPGSKRPHQQAPPLSGHLSHNHAWSFPLIYTFTYRSCFPKLITSSLGMSTVPYSSKITLCHPCSGLQSQWKINMYFWTALQILSMYRH